MYCQDVCVQHTATFQRTVYAATSDKSIELTIVVPNSVPTYLLFGIVRIMQNFHQPPTTKEKKKKTTVLKQTR